jgi:hypothetical protein
MWPSDATLAYDRLELIAFTPADRRPSRNTQVIVASTRAFDRAWVLVSINLDS